MDSHMKGYICALLSGLFVAATFIINTIVIKSVNIASVAFFEFLFALLVSILLLVMIKKFHTLNLLRKYWKPMIIFGVFNGIAVILWFYALALIGPSLLSFFMRFGLLFTVLLGVIFLKEKFTKIEAVGMAIAVIGALIISFNNGNLLLIGTITGVLVGLLIAVTGLIVKVYIKHISPLTMNNFRLFFTFLFVTSYLLTFGSFEIPSAKILFLIFLGALSAPVFGQLLFFKAIEFADLSKVTIIRSLDPFIIISYSFIFFRSVPTTVQLLGGSILTLGVVLMVVARYRPKIIERWFP